ISAAWLSVNRTKRVQTVNRQRRDFQADQNAHHIRNSTPPVAIVATFNSDREIHLELVPMAKAA
ncbi:MAG: hypothetical protein R6V26_11230, partial [Roseovarius sp.]